MSGFVCKRNADVDMADLQSQFTDNVCVYMMMFPHKCCLCGGRCNQYIKIYKKENRWTIAKEEDEPRDACVIGSCCFDKTKIKTDTRERRRQEKEAEVARLEYELEKKKVELASM